MKPEVRSREIPITEWETVPEQQTQTYTVSVPYTEKQQVPVRVCRHVAQTVTRQVPVPAICPAPCGAACPTGVCE